MDRVRGLLRAFRAVLGRGASERDLSDEFAFHIDMQASEYEREGLAPAEARRRALVAFGGVDRYKERVREARWTRVPEDVVRDVRYALRGLGRSRGFAIVAVVTVAIGIGATTAVASLLNAILLRPLPAVPERARLYDVTESRSGMLSDMLGYRAIEWARYEKYAIETARVWSGLAAHRYVGFSLATDAGAVAVNGSLTSHNYFDVLGVRPRLGRFYGAGDVSAAVLSSALWASRFGSDPAVVGSVIRLDGRPFTVVGVAPPEFTGLTTGIRSDVFAPLEDYWAGERSGGWDWVAVFGRLARDVDPARAAAVIQAASTAIEPEQSFTEVRAARLVPASGLPTVAVGGFQAFLTMLFATAVLVLMIAAGNVAGMLLARSATRGREVAIRLAIGVSRPRLVRQLLAESAVLFVIGGAGGILLAFWLTAMLARSIPAIPATVALDVTPDLRVLSAALLGAALTGIVFGLAPALGSTRTAVMDALRRGSTGLAGRTRGRSLFVGAQFAMSVVLVVVAGLFVRSLRAVVDIDPAFEADGVVAADINLVPHGYDRGQAVVFWDRLLERLRAQPGIEQAGFADWGLLFGPTNGSDVEWTDPTTGDARRTNARFNGVDPGWLDAMRVPIVAGRAFTEHDAASSPAVLLVNETLASRLWPDADPVGQVLRLNARDREVIGVTRDGRYSTMTEAPTAMLFLPWAQFPSRSATLHVRSTLEPARVLEIIRADVAALDPDIAIENAGSVQDMVGMTLFPQRFGAWLIGGFGIAGLILATIGVYGVLAFEVERNTREFGVRGALGANRLRLIATVVRRGLTVAAAGTLAGLALAAGTTRFIGSFLYGIDPLDPATFAAAGALMLTVALIAALVPARRASAIPPMQALRAE